MLVTLSGKKKVKIRGGNLCVKGPNADGGPGGEGGPCENTCGHPSCNDLFNEVAYPCSICNLPIGFDRQYRMQASGRVHLSCMVLVECGKV